MHLLRYPAFWRHQPFQKWFSTFMLCASRSRHSRTDLCVLWSCKRLERVWPSAGTQLQLHGRHFYLVETLTPWHRSYFHTLSSTTMKGNFMHLVKEKNVSLYKHRWRPSGIVTGRWCQLRPWKRRSRHAMIRWMVHAVLLLGLCWTIAWYSVQSCTPHTTGLGSYRVSTSVNGPCWELYPSTPFWFTFTSNVY